MNRETQKIEQLMLKLAIKNSIIINKDREITKWRFLAMIATTLFVVSGLISAISSFLG